MITRTDVDDAVFFEDLENLLTKLTALFEEYKVVGINVTQSMDTLGRAVGRITSEKASLQPGERLDFEQFSALCGRLFA